MAHLNFQHNGGFDDDKMSKLRSVVKRRSPGVLNAAEVDDIASSILMAAAVTAAKAGTEADLATIAFAYARNATFYSRAHEQAVDLRMAISKSAADGDGQRSDHDFIISSQVRSVLGSVPPDLARVLWLRDAEGYTLAETSDILGVPVPTLHRRHAAARAAFQAAWAA